MTCSPSYQTMNKCIWKTMGFIGWVDIGADGAIA
jgi:hypothetical protein